MNPIPAYPLQWPLGWKRAPARKAAQFRSSKRAGGSRELSVADAVARVRDELFRMGVGDWEMVISTNLELRLDGFPRSNQPEPADCGAAVYWRDKDSQRLCIAIDRYDRVADNLAAIAATLDAMRAIERHGGAEILNRAFTGFAALPDPNPKAPWWVVLGVPAHFSTQAVREAYRRARSAAHPDNGGEDLQFHQIEQAWRMFCIERNVTE